MRCSASPTISSAAEGLDGRDALGDPAGAALFATLVGTIALRPLADAMGPLGGVVVQSVAETIARARVDGGEVR